MTVKIFVRIVWTVFEKIEKSTKWSSFCDHFRTKFGCFSDSSHPISMSLRTQNLWVSNDCANFYNRMDRFLSKGQKKKGTIA